MKLELRDVKVHDDLSEETVCFSAKLYVDGVRAADVSNDGHGGSHRYFFWDRNLRERVREFVGGDIDRALTRLLVRHEK